jgi:hypothetical protein
MAVKVFFVKPENEKSKIIHVLCLLPTCPTLEMTKIIMNTHNEMTICGRKMSASWLENENKNKLSMVA